MVTVTQILTAARMSRDTIHNITEQQLAGPSILQQIENDLRAKQSDFDRCQFFRQLGHQQRRRDLQLWGCRR
jgi:hypothetical protein